MFIFFAGFVCLAGFSLQGAQAASCHLREIDLCLATILLSATGGIPTNDDALDAMCEPVQEGVECFGNYSASCFTPMLQEVYAMVMDEPMKYQTMMCTPGTAERAQYLKNSVCFEKALSVDNMKPHIEDLITVLETAAEAKFQQRIPTMCCGIQRLFHTVLDIIKSNCGEAVIEEGSQMIGMSASSLSDVFCKGYEHDSAQCSGILPPAGTPSKGGDSKVQLIQFMNTALANWQ